MRCMSIEAPVREFCIVLEEPFSAFLVRQCPVMTCLKVEFRALPKRIQTEVLKDTVQLGRERWVFGSIMRDKALLFAVTLHKSEPKFEGAILGLFHRLHLAGRVAVALQRGRHSA